MQLHTINYFDFFDIDYDPITGWHDLIYCESCGSNECVDLHHIERRMKGNKKLDNVINIIALCRTHHNSAHANALGYDKQTLKDIHLNHMRITKPDKYNKLIKNK